MPNPFSNWKISDVEAHNARTNKTSRLLSNPKPERNQAPALGNTAKGETQGLGRTTVRFTGYRVRPLDPDNFAGSVKDLLDGIRHSRLIPDDSPEHIRLETQQVKVAHYKDERTEIEIATFVSETEKSL